MKTVRCIPCFLIALLFVAPARLRAEEPKDAPKPVKKEQLTEEPPEDTRKRMLSKKISVTFANTRLRDAVALIQAMTKLPINLDPKLEATRITLQLKEMDVGTVLKWIARQAGTSYELKDQRILIPSTVLNDPEKPDAAMQEANESVRAKFAGAQVTLEFLDTPLPDCVNFFRSIADVDIVVENSIIENIANSPAMNLKVAQMQAGIALEWTMKLSELEYHIVDKAVYIHKPKAP